MKKLKKKVSLMENRPEMPTSPFAKFFKFENPDTYKELDKVISEKEGVMNISAFMDQYVRGKRFQHTGHQYMEVKELIKLYWARNPEISMSELVGLFHTVLSEIQLINMRGAEKIADAAAQKIIDENGGR